jgi:cell division protein FtsB
MPAGEGGPGAGSPVPSPRPKLTSRAAVLVVVICAIALSLAYPVREYIAERRQINQLDAENAQLATRVARLRAEQQQVTSPTYIEQQARDQLHMCFPTQVCYVVVDPTRQHGAAARSEATIPWYAVLWASVREADKVPKAQRR